MEIPSVDFIHLLTIGPLAGIEPGSTGPHRVPIKPRLAPSLSFIVISIHYSVHYMT
jgi:histidinol phosphatase-like PHP family hydrolase